MSVEEVTERVKAIAEPLVEHFGCELVEVEFATGRGARVLRVYIDKPEGITLGDCTNVSRELSAVLDVEDPVPGSYSLEVSSPGLDRPLVKEKDFQRVIGDKVNIKTKTPLDGRKNFKVTIEGVEGGAVTVLDAEGRRWAIEFDNIDKARLEFEL